jgi:hypothetical protein
VFNRSIAYRDKKVVGVFVLMRRFSNTIIVTGISVATKQRKNVRKFIQRQKGTQRVLPESNS